MSQRIHLISLVPSQPGLAPSTLPYEEGFFTYITCSVAGDILVKGTGIKEYIAANGDWTGHIDPATGVAGVGSSNCAANGLYEALPTTQVTIAMTAGQTIEGSFTHIATGSGFKGTAGCVSIDASGSEYTFAS